MKDDSVVDSTGANVFLCHEQVIRESIAMSLGVWEKEVEREHLPCITKQLSEDQRIAIPLPNHLIRPISTWSTFCTFTSSKKCGC